MEYDKEVSEHGGYPTQQKQDSDVKVWLQKYRVICVKILSKHFSILIELIFCPKIILFLMFKFIEPVF